MSKRSSRGSRLYEQEVINEREEEGECPQEEAAEFRGEYQGEPERVSHATGGMQSDRQLRSGMIEQGPQDGGQFEDRSPGRRSIYQQAEYASEDAKPMSPRHMSFHERSRSRSVAEQRAEDEGECEEEPPPRAASPQYRRSMSPRETQHSALPSASPYTPRSRVTYEDGAMNANDTVSPYDESTMYREIAPLNSARDLSGSPKSTYSPGSPGPQAYGHETLDEQQQFSPSECPENQGFAECAEPRNSSGSPRRRASPSYPQAAERSAGYLRRSPYSSSMRTPPSGANMNEECAAETPTYGKSGTSFARPPASSGYMEGAENTSAYSHRSPYKSSIRTAQPSGANVGEECAPEGATYGKSGTSFARPPASSGYMEGAENTSAYSHRSPYNSSLRMAQTPGADMNQDCAAEQATYGKSGTSFARPPASSGYMEGAENTSAYPRRSPYNSSLRMAQTPGADMNQDCAAEQATYGQPGPNFSRPPTSAGFVEGAENTSAYPHRSPYNSSLRTAQQAGPDGDEECGAGGATYGKSGAPGISFLRPQASPGGFPVPQNSPAVKNCYPHRASLRTPQPLEDEECPGMGGTYKKSAGPDYLGMNTGGCCPTPSSAPYNAPSCGKYALTHPINKGRGGSPPMPCATPANSKRDALEHLSQLTVTKHCQTKTRGPQDMFKTPVNTSYPSGLWEGHCESWSNSPQTATIAKCRPCPGGTPREGNREQMQQCGAAPKAVPGSPRCKRALDFAQLVDLTTCDPDSSPPRRLPKKPELSQNQIKELIDSESEDVGFAWLLSSEEKPTYKKPCPKQTKAQMTVKQIVEAAKKSKADPCQSSKEYPPMLEPEPEDLSPEVAAAMMFSQEQGVNLDSCPDQTIKHLFSSEYLQKKPPPSKISIVDPNQKDKEELMEKSASVPSEGVSDSAYTRTMKQKGGDEIPSQKSYDLEFALGQEKREVVLVPQRPKRFNMIQFRGDSAPFSPGYFSAFPDQTDGIKLVPSPSKLFLKAWIMTNPANLPATDIIVID